jgi:hypothetical protein
MAKQERAGKPKNPKLRPHPNSQKSLGAAA